MKRFDRTPEGRVHVHTLSGMLHSNPGNFTVDYDHFAKVTQMLTRDIREVEKVIRLAAFNIYACNQDDHSKNVALQMDKNGSWNVAPAYDLTFHRTTYSEHNMLLNGKGKPKEEDLIKFAQIFGLTKQKAKAISEQVKDGVSKFKTLAVECDMPKKLIKDVAQNISEKLSKKKSLGASLGRPS